MSVAVLSGAMDCRLLAVVQSSVVVVVVDGWPCCVNTIAWGLPKRQPHTLLRYADHGLCGGTNFAEHSRQHRLATASKLHDACKRLMQAY